MSRFRVIKSRVIRVGISYLLNQVMKVFPADEYIFAEIMLAFNSFYCWILSISKIFQPKKVSTLAFYKKLSQLIKKRFMVKLSICN